MGHHASRFAAIGALRVLLQMMICCAQCAAAFLEDTLEPSLSLRKCQCGGVFCLRLRCCRTSVRVDCKMLSGGTLPAGSRSACGGSCLRTFLWSLSQSWCEADSTRLAWEPTVAFEMFLLERPARALAGARASDGRCVGLGWYVSSLVQLTVMTPGLVLLIKRTWGLALLALAVAVPRLIPASAPVLPWTQVLIGRGVGVEPWLMGIFASLLIDRVRNMSPTPQNGTDEKDEKVVVVVVGEEEHVQEGTWQKRRIAMPAIGLWLAMLLTFFTVGLLNAEQWRNWGSYVCTAAVPMISLGLIIADVVMTPSAFYDLPWIGTMASVTYEAHFFGAAVGTLTYTNLAPALGIDDVRLAIPLHLVLLYMLAYPIHRVLEFFRKVIEKHASALCCSHVRRLRGMQGWNSKTCHRIPFDEWMDAAAAAAAANNDDEYYIFLYDFSFFFLLPHLPSLLFIHRGT